MSWLNRVMQFDGLCGRANGRAARELQMAASYDLMLLETVEKETGEFERFEELSDADDLGPGMTFDDLLHDLYYMIAEADEIV